MPQLSTDLVSEVEATLAEDYRKVATKLLDNLVDATPVDTGRLKANWNVSKGNMDTTYDEALTDPGGSIPKENGRATTTTAQLENTIYYTNATPYGNYVNAGTDKQRPQRFVEGALNSVGLNFD